MVNWLYSNWIEIVGTITGLVYIFLEIKENKLMWPVGIITSVFFLIVFANSKIYADMSLQAYYVVISIYGWYYWSYGNKNNNSNELPISRLNLTLTLKLLIITSVIFVIFCYVLIQFTDSPIPYWDSFTTAFSITATWMLARKILEQWLVWIVVNLVSIFLYIYRDLNFAAFLMFVYMALAIVGYFKWKKSYNLSKTNL